MFENLRNRLATAIIGKQSALSPFHVLSNRQANVPVYTDMTVSKATREGYKISIYVYRAVRTIVQAASAIPWVVQDNKGEPIDGHEFTKVWSSPNPEFSGQDNMEFLIAHQLLVGNALLQPIIVSGRPREFWVVMPDLVKPIPSDVRGEWLKGWEVNSIDGTHHVVPPEQFIHFMMMDPGNPYWGTSPLMAAARTIDTDNEAQDTQKLSMQNRATPDGVFAHETPLTQEQFEEARRQIKENFLGKSKKREPWVLGAGAKWIQMSMTPVEMDFVASRLHNKRDIAGAFGISPIFLGDLEQSSYNNMMEARKALYEDVVIPLMDDIKSTLNLKVASMYGDIIITYDTSKVAALREDFTKKVDQAKNLWSMGIPFDQINERLEMGFEEFTGWDRGYLPLTLLPTGGSSGQAQERMKMLFLGKLMGLPIEELQTIYTPPLQIVESTVITKAFNLTTEEQKAVHWKRIDGRRVAWWGVVQKKVLPLYEDEGKAVGKAIKGKAPDKLIDAAEKAINAGRTEWEKMLTAISAALISDFGNEIADDLGAEKSDKPSEFKWTFDPMNAIIRAWIIKHGAESIKSILATNLDDVKMVILAGIEKNMSNVEIGGILRGFYTDRSAFKAMRVARTETSHSSGFGQREAARQSGVAKKKMWISSRDDRVRDEHVAMDTGKWVDFNEPYSNGEMYAGENSIMCRCAEGYGTGK